MKNLSPIFCAILAGLTFSECLIHQELFASQINLVIDDQANFLEKYVEIWEQMKKFNKEPLKSIVTQTTSLMNNKTKIADILTIEATNRDIGSFLLLLTITQLKQNKVKLKDIIDLNQLHTIEIGLKKPWFIKNLINEFKVNIYDKIRLSKNKKLDDFLNRFQTPILTTEQENYQTFYQIMTNVLKCHEETSYKMPTYYDDPKKEMNKEETKKFFRENFSLFNDSFFDDWVDELAKIVILKKTLTVLEEEKNIKAAVMKYIKTKISFIGATVIITTSFVWIISKWNHKNQNLITDQQKYFIQSSQK